jgi:hypothetical protein
MDERIRARIAALEAAEQHAIGQLNAIRGALAELRALLTPEPQPTLSGDPLGEVPT